MGTGKCARKPRQYFNIMENVPDNQWVCAMEINEILSNVLKVWDLHCEYTQCRNPDLRLDIVVEHDLLKNRVRKEIKKYLAHNQPLQPTDTSGY